MSNLESLFSLHYLTMKYSPERTGTFFGLFDVLLSIMIYGSEQKKGEVIPIIRLRMYQDGDGSQWRHLGYNSRISKKGTAKLSNRTTYIHEKCRTTRTAFRCYTGRIARTIFDANHYFNIVATLFRMAATLFQHC